MKTQIITIAIAFLLSFNVSFAKSNTINATPDQLTVNALFEAANFESSLDIQEWMTSDIHWNKNLAIPAINVQVEEEAALEIESWMTDNNLWQPKQSQTNSKKEIVINGITFKIYDYNNDKEQALTVEAWMVNDKLWKRYQFENEVAKK